MLNTLGQFGRSPAENARQHLKSFLEICNSFKIHVVSNDVLKLKLFPYSLRDKAKEWWNNLPPGSLISWTELCRSFLAKFNYTNMTDNLRNQITSFRQEDDEDMHEAWERYRDLFRRCSIHGLSEWTQVSIFYNSVNTHTRMMLDASANGTLLDKPPKEGLEILEKLAQNDYQHPISRRGNMRRGTTQLDSSDTILAQISTLTNMVKNMQRQPSTQEVKALDAFCELCGNNHDASECGQNPETSCYVGEYNKNVRSNTYNPEWRKNPNFSWQNQNNSLNPQPSTQQGYQNQPRQYYQQPSNYRTLENTLNTFMTQTSAYMARTDQFIQKTDAFMDRTEMRIQNQEDALKSLENQVGRISQVLKSRPNGGFPSDTEVAKGTNHEQCKAISTRSGKVLETPPKRKQGEITVTNSKVTSDIDIPAQADIPAEAEEDHTDPPEVETVAETPQPKNSRTDKIEEIRPPPPFPQRLKKQKQEYQFKKFFEILKQIHINLPLVEALQQMPNYARFLKDMVFRKNRIGEFETVAATKTCPAMMHNKVPAKKTDPGSFTIPCSIGHNHSTKALCDPGASINLMPKSVFQKLGIGEAKPTTVMLQLADHSFVPPEERLKTSLYEWISSSSPPTS
ncbi:hypothetical protein V6N12_013349 [Hibiscus sabdariffa]|uniref:Retrotransposon gag domain-containing protein n=1 Tax=Hibiscus sabdariffa TaxID=183260 RepID=A0ABR2D6A1_9ROSI